MFTQTKLPNTRLIQASVRSTLAARVFADRIIICVSQAVYSKDNCGSKAVMPSAPLHECLSNFHTGVDEVLYWFPFVQENTPANDANNAHPSKTRSMLPFNSFSCTHQSSSAHCEPPSSSCFHQTRTFLGDPYSFASRTSDWNFRRSRCSSISGISSIAHRDVVQCPGVRPLRGCSTKPTSIIHYI